MGVWGQIPQQGPGQSPWWGREAKPPEAEAVLAFGRSIEAANLPTFLKFGNAKTDICVIFAKKSWVATKLGSLEQN